MNLEPVDYRYTFDKGLNLLQRKTGASQTRIIAAANSNRAVNSELYSSSRLTSMKKASLDQAFIDEGFFDKTGNQLKSVHNAALTWDYCSMLQSTTTVLKDQDRKASGQLNEYNLYAKTGRRNRKISEKTDALGKIVEIQEALYLGNLEYRTTWVGKDLSYNGEVVNEGGTSQDPYEAYVALRIRQGQKQVSEKRLYTVKDGVTVNEFTSSHSLDNNIDSCELQLDNQGELSGYYASKPYGETAVKVQKKQQHPYQYSGQEKDESGLYFYGYRSLLPQNFRWMSADPSGVQGSGLNWYAMVSGNPVSMRDRMGLDGDGKLYNPGTVFNHWVRTEFFGRLSYRSSQGVFNNTDSNFWGAFESLVKGYQYDTIEIADKATFNLMVASANVLIKTQAFFKYGAANQLRSVRMSNAESLIRYQALLDVSAILAYATMGEPGQQYKNALLLAERYETGTCENFAVKSYEQFVEHFKPLFNDYTFFYASFKDLKHHALLVMHCSTYQKYIQKKDLAEVSAQTVVVDGWVEHPQVVRLSEYSLKDGENKSHRPDLKSADIGTPINFINVMDPIKAVRPSQHEKQKYTWVFNDQTDATNMNSKRKRAQFFIDFVHDAGRQFNYDVLRPSDNPIAYKHGDNYVPWVSARNPKAPQ